MESSVRALPVHRVKEISPNFSKIHLNDWDYSFALYKLMKWADIPDDDEPDPKCICVYGDNESNIIFVFEQNIIDQYGIKVSEP